MKTYHPDHTSLITLTVTIITTLALFFQFYIYKMSQSNRTSQPQQHLAIEPTTEPALIFRPFSEYLSVTKGRKQIYDPKEWKIVSEPAPAYVFVNTVSLSSGYQNSNVQKEALLPASERDMTTFPLFNVPDAAARLIWKYSLAGPRVIKLVEVMSNGTTMMSPQVAFYHGKRISFLEATTASQYLGSVTMNNIYTIIDLRIPKPIGISTMSRNLTIDAKKDTIVLEIIDGAIPNYISHIDLSAIKHLALEFSSILSIDSGIPLLQKATITWDVAARFPNLVTVNVIIGKTTSRNQPPHSEFRLVKINDTNMKLQGTWEPRGDCRGLPHPISNTNQRSGNCTRTASFLQGWTETARFYYKNFAEKKRDTSQPEQLRMKNVKLEVSMVAWFHGSSTEPRECTRVALQPTNNVRYTNVVFWTNIFKEPIDLEKTIGKQSSHFLTFENEGFRIKATATGKLIYGLDVLEDAEASEK